MGSGKGGGSPGSDPNEIMRANALYNRLDQFTPEGSVQFSGDNRNVMTVERTPEEQALIDSQRGLRQNALGMMLDETGGGTLDSALGEIQGLGGYLPGADYDLGLDSLPGIPGMDDFGAERASTEQAMMDRAMGLINPQFDRRRLSESSMLNNRGIPETAAVAREYSDRFGEDYGEAVNRAAYDAVGAGSAEQSRLFDLGLQSHRQTLGDRLAQVTQNRGARGQLFSELTGLGGQSFNQLASILGLTPGGGPGGALAGFNAPGQVDTTGAYGTAQNAYNMNQMYDPLNQMIQLGGSLGAAGITAASDINLKKNISKPDGEEILKALEEMNVYRWLYKAEPDTNAYHIGPMAQDFNKMFETPGGDDTIDIVSVCGVLLTAVKELSSKVKELENANQ